MVYDFWDYFMAWSIALALLMPLAIGLLVQFSVAITSLVVGFGGASAKPREKYLTVRVRSYDYDEDN